MIAREVIYSSGAFVPRDQILPLALMYEKVFLPARQTHQLVEISPTNEIDYAVTGLYLSSWFEAQDQNGELTRYESIGDYYAERALACDEMIQTGVFEYLPHTESRQSLFDFVNTKAKRTLSSDELVRLNSLDYALSSPTFRRGKGAYMIPVDMLFHLSREDKSTPELCVSNSQVYALKSLIAERSIRLQIPNAIEIDVDQIMVWREKTEETREGFSAHMQKLVFDVMPTSERDRSLPSFRNEVELIVETKVLPSLSEFQRQLDALALKDNSRLTKIATEISDIEASVFSPSFWLKALDKMGMFKLLDEEETRRAYTNHNQAMHFLSILRSKTT